MLYRNGWKHPVRPHSARKPPLSLSLSPSFSPRPYERLSEVHVAFPLPLLLSLDPVRVVFIHRQGVKFDNKAALLIVEMYINTRGVGLAEAFENKCRTEYGLPPDRRSVRVVFHAGIGLVVLPRVCRVTVPVPCCFEGCQPVRIVSSVYVFR